MEYSLACTVWTSFRTGSRAVAPASKTVATALKYYVSKIASFIGNKVGSTTAKTPQVLKNKAKGDAFRDEIADLMQKEGLDVQKEVVKKTPFGKRVIDIEVSNDGKILGGIETKAGRSRYKPSQRSKDKWLQQFEDYPVNVVRDQ